MGPDSKDNQTKKYNILTEPPDLLRGKLLLESAAQSYMTTRTPDV